VRERATNEKRRRRPRMLRVRISLGNLWVKSLRPRLGKWVRISVTRISVTQDHLASLLQARSICHPCPSRTDSCGPQIDFNDTLDFSEVQLLIFTGEESESQFLNKCFSLSFREPQFLSRFPQENMKPATVFTVVGGVTAHFYKWKIESVVKKKKILNFQKDERASTSALT
jgi:hypothetical protein